MNRDVTVDPLGRFHDVATAMAAPWTFFLDGQPVATPGLTYFLYPRIASNGAISVVAGCGGTPQGDTTVTVTSTGVVTVLGTSYGQMPVCLEWLADTGTFVLYAVLTVNGKPATTRYVLDASGNVIASAPYAIETGSQGFLDCVNGVPLTTDANRLITVGGHTLALPMTRGPWTVGQTTDGKPFNIAAWNASSSTYWLVAEVPSSFPPRVALSGPDARFAVSYSPDVPLLTKADLRPYPPPVPPIPPIPPIPPNGGPVSYLSYQLVNGKPEATPSNTVDAHSKFQQSGNLLTLEGIAIGFNVQVFGAPAPNGLLNFNRTPFNSADWKQTDMGDFGRLKPQTDGTVLVEWPL